MQSRRSAHAELSRVLTENTFMPFQLISRVKKVWYFAFALLRPSSSSFRQRFLKIVNIVSVARWKASFRLSLFVDAYKSNAQLLHAKAHNGPDECVLLKSFQLTIEWHTVVRRKLLCKVLWQGSCSNSDSYSKSDNFIEVTNVLQTWSLLDCDLRWNREFSIEWIWTIHL